ATWLTDLDTRSDAAGRDPAVRSRSMSVPARPKTPSTPPAMPPARPTLTAILSNVANAAAELGEGTPGFAAQPPTTTAVRPPTFEPDPTSTSSSQKDYAATQTRPSYQRFGDRDPTATASITGSPLLDPTATALSRFQDRGPTATTVVRPSNHEWAPES